MIRTAGYGALAPRGSTAPAPRRRSVVSGGCRPLTAVPGSHCAPGSPSTHTVLPVRLRLTLRSRFAFGSRCAPGLPSAHDSAPAAAAESADTSTGSGRMVRDTLLPAGSLAASAVLSCAMIVVSPRSTVTRLVAPRNVDAITVPVSGPESPVLSEARGTASGRTSAVTGPGGVDRSTNGRSRPRTVTVDPLTVPASRLVRPTNSATNEVAGRE